MTKTVVSAALVVLGLAAAMLPATVWAQGSLPCTGSGTDKNGVIQTNGFTPPGGVDAQCDALVLPNGSVTIQDGPSTASPDGTNARHEGVGHAF